MHSKYLPLYANLRGLHTCYVHIHGAYMSIDLLSEVSRMRFNIMSADLIVGCTQVDSGSQMAQ